jgi:hypothetical protein
MSENFKEYTAYELIECDQTLMQLIDQLKNANQVELFEYAVDVERKLTENGVTREELQQVPAFHAIIGSTIPTPTGIVRVLHTLSRERQESIEGVIRKCLEERFL